MPITNEDDYKLNWAKTSNIADNYGSIIDIQKDNVKMTLKIYCGVCNEDIGTNKCYVRLSSDTYVTWSSTSSLIYICSDACLGIYDLRKG